MGGFLNIPEGHVTLKNATVPGCLIGSENDLDQIDISIRDGQITDAHGTPVDMKRAMVLPCFTDMHTHLVVSHLGKLR